MLAAWARGDDLDALGAALPAASAWQAELWRRLRARIGVPDLAERTGRACERIADDPSLLDLPARLALFGLTRVPAGHLQIMRALAAGRDLHLLLLHPSPALWEKVTHRAERSAGARRDDDRTVTLAANRLLASWGAGLARDAAGADGGRAGDRPTSTTPRPRRPQTLLGRIQHDVREDRRAPGAPLPGRWMSVPCWRPMTAVSRSIRVTAARARWR